jgi:hypothetical protein
MHGRTGPADIWLTKLDRGHGAGAERRKPDVAECGKYDTRKESVTRFARWMDANLPADW